MNDRLARTRLLKRIAQAQGAAPPVANTAAPAPPPPFQASSAYPGIRNGFNSASIALIDQLCNILNTALQYASNGKANFQIFRNNNFNFDTSGAADADQKNLMIFSQLLYRTLLNSGNPFPQLLNGAQIQNMVQRLSNLPALASLSQTNPTGIIAQKIPGNLKTNILTQLQYLTAANPVTQK